MRCLRSAHERDAAIEIVAINDITDTATLAALLRHDSVYGRFPGTVEERDRALVIDGNEIRVLAEPDPAKLPWGELGVDVVMECTGRFRTRAGAAEHLDGRRSEGDHLSARQGRRARGRNRGARGELRRGL